jgi:hypothetical protein
VRNHRRRRIAVYRNHFSLHIICAFPENKFKKINLQYIDFIFLLQQLFDGDYLTAKARRSFEFLVFSS